MQLFEREGDYWIAFATVIAVTIISIVAIVNFSPKTQIDEIKRFIETCSWNGDQRDRRECTKIALEHFSNSMNP